MRDMLPRVQQGNPLRVLQERKIMIMAAGHSSATIGIIYAVVAGIGILFLGFLFYKTRVKKKKK